jgi:hypothetical protein
VSIPTAKVEEIRDAAQLIGYREDSTAERDDKAAANDDLDEKIRELVLALPKKVRPTEEIDA